MKRIVTALLILAIFQLSCGVTPSLWGTAPTPTPPLPPASNFPETPVIFPSQAPTLTPGPTSTAITSFVTPTRSGTGLSVPVQPATESVAQILYYAKSGDTLGAIARRFNVDPSGITSSTPLPEKALIDPGTLMFIPNRISQGMTPNLEIMPDSEVILSRSAVGFDIKGYIEDANGYLARSYSEYLGSTGWIRGPEAIKRLAFENSLNPRLLLALLEYEARWVRGQPVDALHTQYPMGYQNFRYKGMFSQMVWAVNQLSIAYYGWRQGTITDLQFTDGTRLRIDPRLNAGTVAIQYLFSKLHSQSQWAQIMDPDSGFPAMYTEMFGDPWARDERVGAIFPAGLVQPELQLPFNSNVEWSYTGGPHGAWEHDGALAAIDFAPATDHGGCSQTNTWVLAAASGMVTRSGQGVVVIDLDGDGFEETGWSLLYLHIATKDRVLEKTWVDVNDQIGHASCEGGVATGTHLHLARKYNGEWVAADGPLPFSLGGWTVVAGAAPYQGLLVKDDKTIVADPVGQAWSVIFRESNVPPTAVGP